MAGKSLGQTLGRIAVLDLASHKRVVTEDLFIRQGNIGLRGTGLLVLKRIAYQKAVERFPATIEPVDGMAAMQFFNAERGHLDFAALEVLSSLASRGNG